MQSQRQFRQRTIQGISPIFNAIHDGDPCALNLIDTFISAIGVSINDKIDTLSNTALHFATIKRQEHIVKHLLSKSADVNIKNDDGETPLQIAIKTDNIPITKLLLDNGSDMNQENEMGLTCFFLAIQFSNLAMVKFLIDYGVNINKLAGINDMPLLPLEWAVRLLRTDVVELLINLGADVNNRVGDTLVTPLHTISMRLMGLPLSDNSDKSKAERIAELLIKAGADINARCYSGSTPLLLAINSKDFSLVELLVKSGCDLSIPLSSEQSGRTPLQLIIIVSGKKKLVDLFLRYGASYYQTDDNGFTAYHWALQNLPNYSFPTIQTLWHYGCPYDLPLFPYTVRSTVFITITSDKHIKDAINCQKTLFDGIRTNNINTIQKALKLGAIVRGTSMDMQYPLHFVAIKGHTRIAKLLLEKGIIVNNLNDNSETALQLAIKGRKFDMCKLLLQYGACLHYKEEIKKLENCNDELSTEIKELLLSVYGWFNLVKLGNLIILKLMKDLCESDNELFLTHINALDKNKRSLLGSAVFYKRYEIAEEIMKNRLNLKQKLLNLK